MQALFPLIMIGRSMIFGFSDIISNISSSLFNFCSETFRFLKSCSFFLIKSLALRFNFFAIIFSSEGESGVSIYLMILYLTPFSFRIPTEFLLFPQRGL